MRVESRNGLVLEVAKLILAHGRPRVDIPLLVAQISFEGVIFKHRKQFEPVSSFDLKLRSQCGLVGGWLDVEENCRCEEECHEEDGGRDEDTDDAPD